MLSKVFCVAVLICAACFPSRSVSQETTDESKGWRLSCLAASVCEIKQSIIYNGVVAATVKVLNSQNIFSLQYIIPIGVNIEHGISVSVDTGEAINTTISNCTVLGCAGRIDLSPGFVAQMKKGHSLNVFFVDPRSHESFTILFNLSGFTNAFSALINGPPSIDRQSP